MIRLIFVVLAGFIIYSVAITAMANTRYPFTSVQQEAQFTHLLGDLRCLVCQNQDLRDSNAALAQDLKESIYQMVRAGKSDTEINQYLTARYGDFILFKPPLKAVTLFLWFGPALFMLLGLFIFWKTCLKQ